MAEDPKKTMMGWQVQSPFPGAAPQQPAYGQAPPPQHPYGQAPTPPQQPAPPPYQQPAPPQQQYGGYQPPQPPTAQNPYPPAPSPQPSYGHAPTAQNPYPSAPPAPQPAYGGYAPQNAYGAPAAPAAPNPYGQQPPTAQNPYGQADHGATAQNPYPPAPAWNPEPDSQSGGFHGKGERKIAGADATVGVSNRVTFIKKTYALLLVSILAFAGLLWCFFKIPFLFNKVSIPLTEFAIMGPRWHWGVVLAAFVGASAMATYFAKHTQSKVVQYLGLGLYVLAESIIFIPLLMIVQLVTANIIAKGGSDPNIIRDAAFCTVGIFAALSAVVFFMKKDFSFLAGALAIGSAAAMMLVILSLIFGFNLGIVFSVAMVVLAAGYILFQTSQVLAHWETTSHVAAALELFSSIALMFWYVIRIFLSMRSSE